MALAIASLHSESRHHHRQRLRTDLLRHHERLIHKLSIKAARAERSEFEVDDVLQAGRIGFCKALDRFDPSRELSIATYAAWWVKDEVQSVVRTGRAIRLPRIPGTRDDRDRVLQAVRDNPDTTAAELNVKPSVFDAIRHSFGLHFKSVHASEATARAVEQALIDNHANEEIEAEMDEAFVARFQNALGDGPCSPDELRTMGFSGAEMDTARFARLIVFDADAATYRLAKIEEVLTSGPMLVSEIAKLGFGAYKRKAAISSGVVVATGKGRNRALTITGARKNATSKPRAARRPSSKKATVASATILEQKIDPLVTVGPAPTPPASSSTLESLVDELALDLVARAQRRAREILGKVG